MSLVEKLRDVNDRLQSIPDRLGVPQYSNVVIQTGTTQRLMVPRPQVLSVDPGTVQRFLGASVELAVDDLKLVGVSRKYLEVELQRAIFLIHATEVAQGIWTGVQTRPIWIDKTELLSYNIYLRRPGGR